MSKKINKKISRRNFLKSSTALAGAAVGSGLITGFPAIHASGTPTIRYLGTAVNMGSEPEKKLFEDTGIKIKYISKTTDEVVKTILTQPNSFDIVDSEYFSMPKLVPSGSLLGMDTNRIKEWSNVVTAFTEGKVNGKTIGDQGTAPKKVLYLKGPKSKEFTSEPSRYVTYNYAQNLWTIGEMNRGMWIHAPTKEYPIAGSCIVSPDQNTNYLYDQEYGHKAEDSDLTAYIESGEISIEDGERFFFMKRVLPDIKIIGSSPASFDITFKTSDFSTVTPFSDTVKSVTYSSSYQPYEGVTIPSLTPVLNTRVRGREFSMKIENTSSDSGWRMGDLRFDLRTDGRR